jgi:hypothetical protein
MSQSWYEVAQGRTEYDADGMWAARRTYLTEERKLVLQQAEPILNDLGRESAAMAIIDEADLEVGGDLWICMDGKGMMDSLGIPETTMPYYDQPAARVIWGPLTDSPTAQAEQWRFARARLLAIGVMFIPVDSGTFVHTGAGQLQLLLALNSRFLTVGWPQSGATFAANGPPEVAHWPFLSFELMPLFPPSLVSAIPRDRMDNIRGVAVSFKAERPTQLYPWTPLMAPEPADPAVVSRQLVTLEKKGVRQTITALIKRKSLTKSKTSSAP